MSEDKTYIAIDPSVKHIGIAYKIGNTPVKWMQVNFPLDRKVARGDELVKCCNTIMTKIRAFGLQNANAGFIEYPNFQMSERGQIAAQKGYTIDLGYVCGFICAAMPKTAWTLKTPTEWKGQQTKEAIGIKFTQWSGIPYQDVSDHCYEAASMLKQLVEMQP